MLTIHQNQQTYGIQAFRSNLFKLVSGDFTNYI